MSADGETGNFAVVIERLRNVSPERLVHVLGSVGVTSEQIIKALDSIERQQDDERWRQNITDMIESLARTESGNYSNIEGWYENLALAAEKILQQVPSRDLAKEDAPEPELVRAAGLAYVMSVMDRGDDIDITLINAAGITMDWLMEQYGYSQAWNDTVLEPMKRLRERLEREGWEFRKLNKDGLYEDEADNY